MSLWVLAFAVMYVYVPFMFLEQAAEEVNGKWRWPFHSTFVLLVFAGWPLVVPLATYSRRRNLPKGLSK